jgi:hypothetical protein
LCFDAAGNRTAGGRVELALQSCLAIGQLFQRLRLQGFGHAEPILIRPAGIGSRNIRL